MQDVKNIVIHGGLSESSTYVRKEHFDRILAERDALQSRLNASEEANDRIRTALAFYADKDHFAEDIRSDWDSVSGEPSNFLWHDDEPWFVEDGWIARRALENKS